MNLKQIQHLLVLSETLNFHRAADQVFLTQSALSRSIAKFEDEIGLQVFDRRGGKVSVTNVGKQVLAKARRLLADSDNFVDDLQRLKTGAGGTVSFGMGPFLAATAMPRILKSYHQQFPRTKLNMHINRWDYLNRLLEDDDIEFFVVDVREIAEDSGISITLLGSPSIAFYCRHDHPLLQQSAGQPIDGQALQGFPIASVAIPPAVKVELKRALSLTRDFSLDIQCDDLLLLTNLLPETDIILLSTKTMQPASLLALGIVELDVRMAARQFGTWGLVKKTNRDLSPASDILTGLLQTHVMTTVVTHDDTQGPGGSGSID